MLNLPFPVRFKSKRYNIQRGKSGMGADQQTDSHSALPHGALILEGRYRLLRLLHQRPRVNLYLAQRLPFSFLHDDHSSHDAPPPHDARQGVGGGRHGRGGHHGPGLQINNSSPLVSIRELVLTGLTPALRTTIEQTTFEEFVSPAMRGSSRLSGARDHICTEEDRHYLIMQLPSTGSQQSGHALTLNNLLNYPQWPSWLDTSTALAWTISLARQVARLDHLGTVLGHLDPATVLVDKDNAVTWAPVLLMSWPPAPAFWPQLPSPQTPAELSSQLFPIGQPDPTNPFIAPELFHGLHDQRSAIYSLGAISYLLLTHFAPVSAEHRVNILSATPHTPIAHSSTPLSECMELIAPHHLNSHIPSALESIVLRTLAIEPDERYTSVFELVEVLEALL